MTHARGGGDETYNNDKQKQIFKRQNAVECEWWSKENKNCKIKAIYRKLSYFYQVSDRTDSVIGYLVCVGKSYLTVP